MIGKKAHYATDYATGVGATRCSFPETGMPEYAYPAYTPVVTAATTADSLSQTAYREISSYR